MMSEINDADRRLLVCVAVAMEPEPWGMGWGRGAAGPPSPLWGGQWKKEVGRGCGGGTRGAPDRSRGVLQQPATACHRRQRTRGLAARKCCRAGDNLGPFPSRPSTSSSRCFCHLPLPELFSAEGPGWGPPLPPTANSPSPSLPPSLAALCPGAEQLPFQ